jgi:hypothetical protein
LTVAVTLTWALSSHHCPRSTITRVLPRCPLSGVTALNYLNELRYRYTDIGG